MAEMMRSGKAGFFLCGLEPNPPSALPDPPAPRGENAPCRIWLWMSATAPGVCGMKMLAVPSLVPASFSMSKYCVPIISCIVCWGRLIVDVDTMRLNRWCCGRDQVQERLARALAA